MSQQLIQQYLNELSDLRRASGTTRESVVSEAFKDLLKSYAKSHDLIFIPQYELPKQDGSRRIVDGALVYDLRVPFGYWEAKDEEDDLDKEIAAKLRRGYPRENIIFEDSRTAVLMQYGNEVMRSPVDNTEKLSHLLDLFFKYERPEIADFRKAVVQFQADLPDVLAALRDMIEKVQKDNAAFRKGATRFLKHAQETINPAVTAEDVREMLIQHILTEEIFSKVFDEDDFHRQNNVAKELYALEGLFFTGALKKTTLKGLEPYYNAIRTTAHQIATHTEKQTFLKVIYEGFYRVYNKKAADRLGVVYTPNEIVRFMIESADRLCNKHFGKALIDKNVEILDPAVGTGTFITGLIDHFRGQPNKLRYKYLEELHANEVAILPYYVANLNIEATYAAINGYEEFPNLCFVDTLDNTAALTVQKNQHVGDLFGGVSDENVARIKRQNGRKISVVIGNPPYNANQLNENENNKNREYPEIDRRIKATFVKESVAHKTKLYDMYARFFRWACDRVDGNGIIAFVTNRSFIESRTFDGFRKVVMSEFSDIYIVDLGGDVRTDPRLSGTKHNVFGIQTGVAISFLVKRANAKGSRVSYVRRPQLETAEEKLTFLGSTPWDAVAFERLDVNERFDWIAQEKNDFADFLPIAASKLSGKATNIESDPIFREISFGTVSNRDDWVYDFDRASLSEKIEFYLKVYAETVGALPSRLPKNWESALDYRIKWTQNLRRFAAARLEIVPTPEAISVSMYRPFCKKFYYYEEHLNWSLYRMRRFYPAGDSKNITIFFSDRGARSPFSVLATNVPAELHLCASTDGFQAIARYQYSKDGTREDSISDDALRTFQSHYAGSEKEESLRITKDAIFRYIYAVLHDPHYREKYAQDLKREFPRVPFYTNFWKWAEWGDRLVALHVGYESVKPWKLKRVEAPDEKSKKAGLAPKALLKASRGSSAILLDSETQLTGVPLEAWTYRLGNRAALEWVLDQYKEKTPKDPTIREKFNTYRFADHKEAVIDLLMRVTRVSVETMEIVEAMKLEKR